MKIFSASQIRACDAYTIHAGHISSPELMERAAGKCTDWLSARFSRDTLFVILCGMGNNGGDGLAITRMLHHLGYGVRAFLMELPADRRPDCQYNLERLQQLDESLLGFLQPDTFVADIGPHIVIIDALFGSGLNRPLEGWPARFVRHINQLPNYKVAIDIPSGMPADTIPEVGAAMMQVNDTLSFQFYKRSFLHPETGSHTGKVHILDIGLDDTFIRSTQTNYQIIDRDTLLEYYKPRQPFTHKGSFGTALIAGGSHGMMGAISLSTRAALRSGAGKVIALVPECGYPIIQSAAPEAICQTQGNNYLTDFRTSLRTEAFGLGPGMGTHEATAKALGELLDSHKRPLVLDADALNILADSPELLHQLPRGSILTPHPGEFTRLFGHSANSMLRLEHARIQAMKYNIVIVLKDRHTAVVSPEGECWYNITGHAGLATAGTGDVLLGLITGLLAQGYTPLQAAMLGVWLHGRAAELALEEQSMESMTAGDVIACLGRAFKTL